MNRCITRDYYLGCFADVITYTDRKCSGKKTCEIAVPDTILHRIQPCPKDLMTYLEASYKCIPGEYYYWSSIIIMYLDFT